MSSLPRLALAPLFATLLTGCKYDNPCEGAEDMPSMPRQRVPVSLMARE